MHETVIANKIIEEANRRKAKLIHVEVGELSELTKEELANALEVFGGKIKITLRNSKVRCQCGYEGRANIIERGHGFCLYNCPNCGKKPDVLEGGEIKIIGIKCA